MFTEIFVTYIQKHNITAYQIAKNTGISQGTMNEYKNGKKMPTIQNLIKISDYIGCSIDYLLGRTDNPNSHKEKSANSVNGNYTAVDNSSVTVSTPVLDEHQKLLIELYNKLPPIEQVELISKLNNANKKPPQG